jgi:hypothetical protein
VRRAPGTTGTSRPRWPTSGEPNARHGLSLRRSVACAALAALLAGACGDGGSGASAENVACTFVTAGDAEKLFGTPAARAPDPGGDEHACIWTGRDAGAADHLLQVRVYESEEFYGEAVYQGERPVEGLGERAFVVEDRERGGTVEVQFVRGGRTYAVSYSIISVGTADGGRAADRADALVHLLKANVGRL